MTQPYQHPPSGPWWLNRKAATDAERLELAAMTFVADIDLERALTTRARHPNVFSPPSGIVLRLEAYEKRRQAATDAGKELQLPSFDLDAIDAAAEFLRATPQRPNPDAVSRAHEQAFREVARSGDWSRTIRAYNAWAAALATARSELSRWFGAHESLGQGLTHGEYSRLVPRLSDALDGAFGYRPRAAAMLPEGE